MGVRPASRAIKVSKTTILKKLKYLGELAEQVCLEKLAEGAIQTSYVQFDEMMAFERTQCLPITIALAVRAKTGEIVSIRAGRIPCETTLKNVSRKKFGEREDRREQTVRQMLRDVALVAKRNNFTIATDSKVDYREWIERELPGADYQKFSGEDLKQREKAMKTVDVNLDPVDYSDTDNYGPFFIKRQKNGNFIKKAYDPLFTVNQKCMKLRASLSRLRRDYWGYTNDIKYLQYHLWIFMALHNGWELPTHKRRSPLPKPEPKIYPTPDLTTFDVPNLSTPKLPCSAYPNKSLQIPASFMREYGLYDKARFKASIDFEKKIMRLTFHGEDEPDSFKFVRVRATGYPSIGLLMRRNDLYLKPGRAVIQWDEKQGCAFVFLGDLLEKKNL